VVPSANEFFVTVFLPVCWSIRCCISFPRYRNVETLDRRSGRAGRYCASVLGRGFRPGGKATFSVICSDLCLSPVADGFVLMGAPSLVNKFCLALLLLVVLILDALAGKTERERSRLVRAVRIALNRFGLRALFILSALVIARSIFAVWAPCVLSVWQLYFRFFSSDFVSVGTLGPPFVILTGGVGIDLSSAGSSVIRIVHRFSDQQAHRSRPPGLLGVLFGGSCEH